MTLRLSRYQPGRLIAHLRHNLGDMEWEEIAPARARFRPPDEDMEITVTEQPGPGLLMHTVSTEFLYSVPSEATGDATITISHRGMARRTGVDFRGAQGDEEQLAPVLENLRSDSELADVLLRLDFTTCSLRRTENTWELRMSHYGASEVAFLFPAYRRYIPLSGEQISALLGTCRALKRLLP